MTKKNHKEKGNQTQPFCFAEVLCFVETVENAITMKSAEARRRWPPESEINYKIHTHHQACKENARSSGQRCFATKMQKSSFS